MKICNQHRLNSGRLVFFLMAVVIARGGVPAEQSGRPVLGSSDSARLPWEIHGPLKVSPDGHSLQYADGTPFFWLGDTAWALHQNLSREDVVRYL
ncbi:MAG: DUF4038 domain-containing protein, partial [Planctomycetes bacterium]|nr:DUF4038 domain-containing protein [Planctomycetota bacterium]